ncbi:MFS transporter [Candidatus Bathyarchaeota archaeon]|nr:MFS transporter [Candidatus Bathyarchaeota archaeon]
MIKDVFSNKNILAISLTTMTYSLVQMTWNPFWPKYLKDNLGATTVAIGLISGIRSAQNMIFALPGGILADRYGRRRIIVYGTFLRTFSPLIYLLAPSWEWIMLASFFTGLTSIYMPAFTAIIADSMPEERRGTGYGVYSTITSLPRIISPLIGGVVMDSFGYVEGLKTFLILQIFVSIFISLIRWKYTEETITTTPLKKRKPILSRELITGQTKPIQVMLLVAIISSFSSRLVMDFMNLYALDVLKITNTQLGIITTGVGLLTAIFALPGGMLSDRYGRKNNIMLSRLTNPLTQWVIVAATDFNGYAIARLSNGFAQALGGANRTAGGPSWNALIADIVPPEKRATVIGTQNTLTAIIGAPSAIFGGWLWQTFSPEMPFMISGIVGLISAFIFWFGVKEPTRGEKLGVINDYNQLSDEIDIEPINNSKK